MTPLLDQLVQQTAASCLATAWGLLLGGVLTLAGAYALVRWRLRTGDGDDPFAIFALFAAIGGVIMCLVSIWWFGAAQAPLQYILQHPTDFGLQAHYQ